jgi:hypothetical protein
MEAMLGISLYSYLYPKLAKMLSFLLTLMFSTKSEKRAEQVLPGSGGGEPQKMYTHVGKYKKYIIKEERDRKKNCCGF